jgi:hypothetical protein
MDPEFKAFVEAVAPECAKARRRNPFAAAGEILVEVFTDAINDIGAFRCDLRPFQRLRAVCRKCEIKQAIGYHGLA